MKEQIVQSLQSPYLQVKFETFLNVLYLWVNFLSDLAKGGGAKASLAFLVAPLSRINKAQT